MERYQRTKRLDTVSLVSRPQESYKCTSRNFKCKNMGLLIVSAIVLVLASKRFFVLNTLSKALLTITVAKTLFNKKRSK